MVSDKDRAELGEILVTFITEQQRANREAAAALPESLVGRYAPRLGNIDRLVRAARVRFVTTLPDCPPLTEKLAALGLPGFLISAQYEAMTFVDTILLATSKLDADDFATIEGAPRKRADATLLHELVHVVQYDLLRDDPDEPNPVVRFTKAQIPDYVHHLRLEPPYIPYDEIAFEDAACETQREYADDGSPDGLQIAYRCMDERHIRHRQLEPVAV